MKLNKFTSQLQLAYSPISNHDFTLLRKEDIIKKLLDKSMLYVLSQREELVFNNVDISDTNGVLRFDILKLGTNDVLNCEMSIYQMALETDESKGVKIHCGFYNVENKRNDFPLNNVNGIHFYRENDEFLLWVSPDKLLYLYNNKLLKINIKGDIEPFIAFKVHYVGKATDQKIWDRLSKHGTLLEILSLETPLNKTSLPTHEVMLLLFEVKDRLNIKTVESEDDFMNLFTNNLEIPNDKTISLDVEKALIKLLNPEYNDPKKSYPNYPKSKDGLFQYNFDDYSFQIIENVRLVINDFEIVGNKKPELADVMLIKNNRELVLNKAGKR